MLRVGLLDIFLFLLPFAVYAGYMLIVKGETAETALDHVPVIWLVGAGFGLLLIAMVTLVSFSGGNTKDVYHPSVLQNGVIKPGRID
jgi:Family of unknown function (DUF6111)